MEDETGWVRLFVYGSLRRGGSHHELLAPGRFVAEGRLWGHRMFVYEEGYPAIAPCRERGGPVVGEVWSVDRELLGRLDEFEGCPELYQRVHVRLEDGSRAQTYCVSADEAEDRPPVAPGDWIAYCARNG